LNKFAVLALAAVIFAGSASAQQWPARPLRIVVPFPPGNAGDVTARAIADKLAQRLGQPVIVDNRAGAQGAIGVAAVAKAQPDGYTLLVTSLSPLVITPAVSRTHDYDTVKDLAPVALIGWTGMILVAPRQFAAASVAETIAYAKAHPGALSYASLGSGTLSMLTMELFKQSAGIDLLHVPYKGSGEALTDLTSGRVSLMFDGMTSSYVQVKAGNLKALAISATRRSVFAPELPTLAESGVAGLKSFDVVGWTGMLAPARTPAAIVDRLNTELGQIMQQPDFKTRVAAQSLDLYTPRTPAQFGDFIRQELARWGGIVKALNIQPE
jgi:tripartite-type tricarboxylate transporter receptor subunit TctC